MSETMAIISRSKDHKVENRQAMFDPLLTWMESHVLDSPCGDEYLNYGVHLYLSQEDLTALQKTLNQLTPKNAEDLLPFSEIYKSETAYDDDYWARVQELKTTVANLLASTDFEKTSLFFCRS